MDTALKISKIIHDNCKDAPHDIGLKLAGCVWLGTSLVQRILRIGFNDATKIIEELEGAGIIKRMENGYQFELTNRE